MRWSSKQPSTAAPMPSLLSMIGISGLRRRASVRCSDRSRWFASKRKKAPSEKRGRISMRRSNFALRVPPTLLAEARKAAESEGVALNQLITLALAEKVSAMRTEEYFEERARRANPAKVSRILARVGKGNPPIEGDELPL